MFNVGPFTVQAGEALEAARRVKLDASASATAGCMVVVYADAGEEFIGITIESAASGDKLTIEPMTQPGFREVEVNISSAIAIGTVLYGAADGMLSDASSGSAQGIALKAAAADYDHIPCLVWSVKSTTAATVSIADAGTFTSQTTVEAALQEIYQHLVTAQGFVPIPLTAWIIGDATNSVSYGGPSTDPILDYANGDTDSALRWVWAAGSVEEIIAQIPLPPDLDTTANIVLHMLTKKDANADTVTIAADSYFMDGDTKVEDVTGTVGQAYAETTITIAAADVPAGAQTLTIELTPGAHASDALYLSATWLEYTKKILTA
jgi:hypothetical protein